MRALWLVLLLPLFFVSGCERPTEEECAKAVGNLQKLRGLEHDVSAPDPQVAVRKCRANGSRESTRCLAAAKTVAEADACLK